MDTESWRGLLADTSQSSIGSSGSPPLIANPDHRQSSRPNVYNYLPLDVSNTRRRGRQGILTEGNTSSLPSNYAMSENDALRYRPEFRKSSSQPTRSLSPPSLRSRSPSQSIGTPTGSGGVLSKKRHLPQVPAMSRRLGDHPLAMSLDPNQINRNWRPTPSHRRPDVVTPSGMYSDSEITMKPVFGNRQFYAHPMKDSAQHQHHRKDSTRDRERHSRRQTSESSSGYREYQSETEGHRERERRDSYRPLRDESHSRRDSQRSRGGRDRRVSTSGQHKGGESGEESETSTNSKISVQSALSTHSDRPRPSRTLR